jgi:hypothetical protein
LGVAAPVPGTGETYKAIESAARSAQFSLLPVKLNDPREAPQSTQVVAPRSGEADSDSPSSPVDLDLSPDIFSEFAG